MPSFSAEYLRETAAVVAALDIERLESLATGMGQVRDGGGRLFVLGVGGSAGHASHAVNDFRKLCSFEAYAPTDNVSELTARTNDEGWDTTFAAWLATSRLGPQDAVLVFSVGGGDPERDISANIANAVDVAKDRGASVFGIVGRDGGHTAKRADACVIIPPLFPGHVTPHTEGLCAVVWHLLISHPALKASADEVGSDGHLRRIERMTLPTKGLRRRRCRVHRKSCHGCAPCGPRRGTRHAL